jgi:hypothetical protein
MARWAGATGIGDSEKDALAKERHKVKRCHGEHRPVLLCPVGPNGLWLREVAWAG